MKKEKQVKTYQRRTKSGKMVTVKAHTAKYDAADKAKEVAKKTGAGKELEERKKKQPVQLEIPFDKEEEKKVLDEVKETAEKESTKKPAEKKATKKIRPIGSGTNGPEPKPKKEKSTKGATSKSESSESAFTAAEFKEWYRGTGSAADKKVAKALRAQLGRSGYRKLEDEAIDNYSSRGHLSMFKRVSGSDSAKSKVESKTAKAVPLKEPHPHDRYEYTPAVKKELDTLLPKIEAGHKTWETKYKGWDNSKESHAFLSRLNKMEERYNKLANSSDTETAVYKDYLAQREKQWEKQRASVAAKDKAIAKENRATNKGILSKYSTTHKEVADFMRQSKRGWRWNKDKNAFITSTAPDGRPMHDYDELSLENAIKRMKRKSGSTEKTKN